MSFLSLSCALSSWRFDVEGSLERVAEATTGFSGREIHKLFLSVQGAVHSSYDNCLTKRIWKKVGDCQQEVVGGVGVWSEWSVGLPIMPLDRHSAYRAATWTSNTGGEMEAH